MTATPTIAVFGGGTSAEREVSLGSAQACAVTLARSFPTRLFRIDADVLPEGLEARRHVVFSTLHGTFGEDGGMQRLLDAAGVAYAGCDAAGSALTMDKTRTKEAVAARGVRVARGMAFAAEAKPAAEAVIAALGESVVVKPNAEGSSVGLSLPVGRTELAVTLDGIRRGTWLVEQRLVGRELSVGVLGGRALGVGHLGVCRRAQAHGRCGGRRMNAPPAIARRPLTRKQGAST